MKLSNTFMDGIYIIIWFRLSVCMFPVQDGGQGGRVYTSSCLHQHFGPVIRCCRRR